jgi:hypothetical protein
MKPLLSLIAAAAIAANASAQTTVLDEDFTTWTWTNVNNNAAASAGWIHDSGTSRAWHEDETGGHTADNTLVSPIMDLSALTIVGAHIEGTTGYANYMANHSASLGDGVSTLEVTTDGGLTWAIVWTDTSTVSNTLFNADIDLSAYAGMTGVQLGLHYFGTYAHEAWFNSVLVDDSLTGPPPAGSMWTVNLPTTFAVAPFIEDFEGSAGTIPSFMALTAEDATTGLPDAEAWCNVGQLASCIIPFSGAFNLEMGLDPSSINYHQVRNAMVLGIDGDDLPALYLEYMGLNGGEEATEFDGIWVSEDGLEWHRISGEWSNEITATAGWMPVLGKDLSATPVDTSGEFYLMFGQQDNYPYNNLDGIGIDDISIGQPTPPPLTYTIVGLIGGGSTTLTIVGATPGGDVLVGYSLTGAGPTMTPFGPVDMSPPISTLQPLVANALGVAVLNTGIPARASGFTLYSQAADVATSRLTNSLAEAIL